MNRIIVLIKIFLKDLFNLSQEQADNYITIKSIEKGVDFKGINIWTLIFAIFVASVGLNVNSAAVIIGAMLISPLMGPIMGLGLSVGIYDFDLLKRSLKNLSIAVIISVLTSATYFFISPLNDIQSELLARTTPTIYDVLIAFFGGLAGIVAGTTKEKGNAIPGVAIATALMPPLCTAGFGIATGNIYFFLGAIYLFFINAVMISLSTLLIVRFLKFPQRQIIDKKQENKVKKYIFIVVAITVIPSIYLGYQIIQQSIFRNNALLFIGKEMNFDKTQIVSKTFLYKTTDSNRIELILTGETIKPEQIVRLQNKIRDYSLGKTKLIVKQGYENVARLDLNQIKSGILEDIYKKNELLIKDKDEKIKILENEILSLKSIQYPIEDLSKEINAINSKVVQFSANQSIIYNIPKNKSDTTIIVYLKSNSRISQVESVILNSWLSQRLKNDSIKVIIEY